MRINEEKGGGISMSSPALPDKNMEQKSLLAIIGKIILYLFLIIMGLVMITPLIWMLSTASKTLTEVSSPQFNLIPENFQLVENIVSAFERAPIVLFFRNSFVVAITVTIGRVLLCALAGYSFAKFTYPGREFLFRIVLSTMMIPFYVVVIPLYIVVFQLGWLNSLTALIVPGLVNAFGIFLMRQFMMSIPQELLDAARIDGASEPRIFITIVLPLVRPALAALAVFTFMSSWDSYIWPLLAVTSQDLLTLPLGLSAFKDEYVTIYNELMAVSLIALIPTFLLYAFFQRQFVEGITMSGIKG
jgi:multiple sugar transport system permease protein